MKIIPLVSKCRETEQKTLENGIFSALFRNAEQKAAAAQQKDFAQPPPSGVPLGAGEALARHGQHQLDAVFLIDLGRAGVVVDGHDVGLGVHLGDLADLALAHDVVG